MNINVKAVWLDRLRNGGIRQGRGKLGTSDGKRCCLGVLCDIAVENGVIPAPTLGSLVGYDDDVLTYDRGNRNYLPPLVMEWAGLDDKNPRVVMDGRAHLDGLADLAFLNDDGWPFSEIADLIEENL